MSIYGSVFPRVGRLARLTEWDLSKEGRHRLKWMDFYRAHGENARLTCRHFGISPDTFYRWKRRYDPGGLSTLEDDKRSRRPRKLREPSTPGAVVKRIRELREQYPRWGKEKLVILLKREGIEVSSSTVGRELKRLKERGLLREPLRVRKKRGLGVRRPWARRKPKDYEVREPGDLVEVDTLDQEIIPGLRRKQFTARDVISKWDVLEAFSRATSWCAARFLDTVERRLPFTLSAIQIDGGSEFKGDFEQECERREIKLFALPPYSPKLNGCVERAQRTHTEEFYEVVEVGEDLQEHNRQLQEQEDIYNTIRPHQALGYLTPEQFVTRWREEKRGDT